MEFLDKETEKLLKDCIDNEAGYPQVLVDKICKCTSLIERQHLLGRINILVTDGYLSKIAWADNLPYRGHIEPKGLDYFKLREIYIRSKLRSNPYFSLSAESENCLQNLLLIDDPNPYVMVNERIGSAAAIQELINAGFIQTGPKGIYHICLTAAL